MLFRLTDGKISKNYFSLKPYDWARQIFEVFPTKHDK